MTDMRDHWASFFEKKSEEFIARQDWQQAANAIGNAIAFQDQPSYRKYLQQRLAVVSKKCVT